METLKKLQVIKDFKAWAEHNKITPDALGILEYLDRKGILKQPSDNKTIFVCDRRKCEDCSDAAGTCTHTTDILHARNFKNENGVFIEIDSSEGLRIENPKFAAAVSRTIAPDLEAGYIRKSAKERKR